MKKLLLSSAIAAAMGVSGFAQAAVDLREDAADRDVNVYASELTIGTGGLTLGASGTELDVLAELGFGVAAGQRRFVRLDLAGGNAELAAAPTVTVSQTLTVNAVDEDGDQLYTEVDGTVPATFELVVTGATGVASQGGVGENFYIVEFTAPDGSENVTPSASEISNATANNGTDATALYLSTSTATSPAPGAGTAVADPEKLNAGLNQDAQVTIAGSEVTVASAESVAATYTLYETAVDAAANVGNELASDSGTLAGFQSALVVAAGPSDSVKKIDVTKESVLFDSSSNDDISEFGELSISLADGDSDTTGVQAFVRDSAGDIIPQLDELIDPASTTAVVSGDFSSAVSLANDSTQVAIADLLNTDGDAVFEVTAADLTGTSKSYSFEYLTDGETVLPEVQFQLTGNLDSVSGFSLPTSIGPVNLNQFEKNGSTTSQTMTLDPNGAFKNFVRISNTSGVEGGVFVQIINDDGESESFALNDVSVGGIAQPETLTAQASTRLIPMSAFVAAAKAQNPDFGTVSAQRNKFRLVVDGEFPTISSNNVTLATDNTTFSTF
jgi:hypothetical protein